MKERIIKDLKEGFIFIKDFGKVFLIISGILFWTQIIILNSK